LNCQSLFAMERIPCDNQIRALLNPVEPQHFFPVFDALRDVGNLDAFRRLDKRVLIAFDGTEYFRSNEICRANCSRCARAGG